MQAGDSLCAAAYWRVDGGVDPKLAKLFFQARIESAV